MSEARVKFYTPLKEKIGQSDMIVVGYDGTEVLNNLRTELGPVRAQGLFGEDGEIKRQYLLVHNERTVGIEEFKQSKIQKGDTVRFVLPIAGG